MPDDDMGAARSLTNAHNIAAFSALGRDEWVEFGPEGDFARQHLLNPAIFGLLGEVRGKRVLDAGCGGGYLSRLLALRGALVTGVEPAAGAYTYAVEQEQERSLGITYVRADLSAAEAPGHLVGAFDHCIANMVFFDIPDYEAAMRTCISALRPGGSLVFTLQHPCFEESAVRWVTQGFVAVREYSREYVYEQRIGSAIHRPLSAYLNLVIREGCDLTEIVEPVIPPELAEPGTPAERNVHVPSFIVVAARRHL